MKRRIISSFLAAAMAATLLAGCGGGDTPKDSSANLDQKENQEEQTPGDSNTEEPGTEEPGGETDQEPVTITIGNWPAPDAETYAAMEEQKENFVKAYPYITVETDEYAYSTDTFLAKAAGGQLPDLFNTFFTETDKIINAGYAEDITEAFNNSEFASAVSPELLELVTRDNQVYGVPVGGYSIGLHCNVALFKEAGLVDADGVPVFPTTWDELAQTSATIKEKTGKAGFFLPSTDGQGGWLFANILWGFGGDFEAQVDGKWTAVFDSEEAVAALQYVKDLKWKYNAMPDNAVGNLNDWMNSYGSDQVAMGLCHQPMANGIVSATGMSKDNMSMTVVPAGPGGQAAQLGGNVYMMAKGTTPQQQDALLKWLLFGKESPITDDEALASFEVACQTESDEGYPVGPTSLQIWVGGDRAEKEQAIREKFVNVDMKLWDPYCQHADEGLRAEPPVNAQELYAVLDSVLQEVLTNENADCQELLSKAAADFQKDYLDNAN